MLSLAQDPKAAQAILVVDDDEFARELMGLFIDKAGLRVFSAECGESALELFRSRNLDLNLAIIDYTMPGMDGIRTFETLRELRPDLRAVLYTGDPDIEGLNQQCPKGLVCMRKEFDTQSLGVMLEQLLNMS